MIHVFSFLVNPTPGVSVLRIEYPALDRLVSFLESQANQQKQIDELVVSVETLTAKLHQSNQRLQSAAEKEA